MKRKFLSALACAATILVTSSAGAGPVNPPKPQINAQGAQIEPVNYWRRHHWRHHDWRRHYGSAGAYRYDIADLAFANIFWPLWGGDCLYGDCGWDDAYAYDPGCYFYGCSYGWSLGPYAWGLFGAGFLDPYGLLGWGYSVPYFGWPSYAGFGGYGPAFLPGLGAAPLAGRHFLVQGYPGRYLGGFHNFRHGAFGLRHAGAYRSHGWRHIGGVHGFGPRHFGGFHRFGAVRFGGGHGFGGHHFMAFHGGGFHGGFGGFHGGGFHGGGFHGGGFHGGHR